jgi:hypothetical protein
MQLTSGKSGIGDHVIEGDWFSLPRKQLFRPANDIALLCALQGSPFEIQFAPWASVLRRPAG